MKNLLFVVHRYAPYPGGSENYVRDMAEEALSRGNNVTVFSGQHQGDLNGVKVTSDPNILTQPFDLIIVHGGDVGVQDFVLSNARNIPSPILFMLILPSHSELYKKAMNEVAYIGCSTAEDWKLVRDYGHFAKSYQVSHGIDKKISIGKSGFKQKFGITTPYMFLSCGGYWANKAMIELADLFKTVGRDDVTLVTTGYDNRSNLAPQPSHNVVPLLLEDRDDVLSALVDADLYIMHSFKEGFGLVLLESMLNNTPWAARYGSGARVCQMHGFTYREDQQLVNYLRDFEGIDSSKITNAYNFVTNHHLIKNTVDDILKVTNDK